MQRDDELGAFNTQDLIQYMIHFVKGKRKIYKYGLYGTVIQECQDNICVQSQEFYSGIPKYVIHLSSDGSYSCYFIGISVCIATLSKNGIRKCKKWSITDEVVRFLSLKDNDHKHNILIEQLSVTGSKAVCQKVNSPTQITRAFTYLCKSRSAYSELRKDLQLPSIRTLGRVTEQ